MMCGEVVQVWANAPLFNHPHIQTHSPTTHTNLSNCFIHLSNTTMAKEITYTEYVTELEHAKVTQIIKRRPHVDQTICEVIFDNGIILSFSAINLQMTLESEQSPPTINL